MKVFECQDPNDNTDFLCKLLNDLDVDKFKYKWVISDLELIPIFHGDYSGIGGNEIQSTAAKFMEKVEQAQSSQPL